MFVDDHSFFTVYLDKNYILTPSLSEVFVFPGCAMRKSHAPCRCCGQHGDPGLTAALSVEEGSTPEPEPVRMETAALDVPWYCTACIADLLINVLK